MKARVFPPFAVIGFILFFPVIAAQSRADAPAEVRPIENTNLSIVFNPANPSAIAELRLKNSGRTLTFLRNSGLVIKTLSVEDHKAQSMQFQISPIKNPKLLENDKTHVRFSGKASALDVDLAWSLPEGRSYLSQTVRVANPTSQPIVLAAIQPWTFDLPRDLYRSSDVQDWGFPAWFAGEDAGLVMSLDFPGAHAFSDRASFRMDYRPMVELQPGETYEAYPAAMIAVDSGDPLQARLAFHEYLRDRMPPRDHYPVAFCTWGPWMDRANEPLARAAMPLLPMQGSDLFLLDGGWLNWSKYNQLIGIGNGPFAPETAEDAIDRLHYPGGVAALRQSADEAGVGLGLYFDVARNRTHVQTPLARMQKEDSFDNVGDYFDLASEAGDRLRDFIAYWTKEYRLDEIKLDFFWPNTLPGAGFRHYDNGYDAIDRQMLKMIEIIETAKAINPGLYVSLASGNGFYSPYWVYWADQMHTIDPGTEPLFHSEFGSQPIYRVLAAARRSAWLDRYWSKWVPPHMIKMDIASHAFQQDTPAAAHPDDEPYIVSEGVDWEQTLFSAIACGRIRDLRTNPLAMHPDQLAFAKKWLDWAEENRTVMDRPIPLNLPTGTGQPDLFAQIENGKGFLYALPGLDESPQWVNALLSRVHGVPPNAKSLKYRLIYPFESKTVTVGRNARGEFEFQFPGPRRCPAVIAEVEFNSGGFMKPRTTMPSDDVKEFVENQDELAQGYPCANEINIEKIVRTFAFHPPAIAPLGQSSQFDEQRDQALMNVAVNFANMLPGEHKVMPPLNLWDENQEPVDLLLVGHAQQENLPAGADFPVPETVSGIQTLRLPNDKNYAGALLVHYPDPRDKSKTVLAILGRTPDEAALALRTFGEELNKFLNQSVDLKQARPTSFDTPTVEDLEAKAKYYMVTPFLKAPAADSTSTAGPVEWTVELEFADGTKTQVHRERLIPMIWREDHPLVLPATRYFILLPRNGQKPIRAISSFKPLEERSTVPPMLRVQIVN